jgi:conjugative transfer pilus assembly protein TraH
LSGIEEKTIEDEQELTEIEKGFLESTRLPVYKFLNVQSSFQRGMILSVTEQYAEIISSDILHAFIDNSIGDLMSANKNGHIPSTYLESFNKMVDQARNRAGELRKAQADKFGTYESMEAKVRMMETRVETIASSLLRI